MDWQQPKQLNNAPTSSYFPVYNQGDAHQLNYNYDEDNDDWDDDEENENYQNQSAYYYNEHQNVDTAARMGGHDGLTEPPTSSVSPSVALATLETDIQNKAAILRAKILEKRAGSRGSNKLDKEETSSAFERPSVDGRGSVSAIDTLVKEARAAAEAQAHQTDTLDDRPVAETRTADSAVRRVSPVDSTPTLTPTDIIQIPSKAKIGGQKSSKQAKNAAKADLRAQQIQQQQQASHKMSKARADMIAKHNLNQNVEQPPSYIRTKTTESGPKETKTQARSTAEDKPDSSAPAAAIKSSADLLSHSETLPSTSTPQQEPPTALVPLVKGSLPVAEDRQESVASYSRHFDDLDEWLEITGYHDRRIREQTLSLHRRRAQLEREMAEVDRELEYTVSSWARSARAAVGRPLSAVPSMPPPPAPESNIAIVDASTKAGTKRARSPEQRESQHADKHQRTYIDSSPTKSSNSDKIGTSSNALPIPIEPRRKDPSPGLNIRGAEKSSSEHKPGQIKDSTRGRSFSPNARRNSAAHDRSDHHDFRGRYATRQPSPKRPIAASYSQSATWTAHEPHRSSGFDPSSSYRGRQNSGSRGGRNLSQGRREHNANTSSLGLGLQRGGCRYFMIKSFNNENVQVSVKEGTWTTQVQNEELFAEAFEHSRHVIFFFSVNNSKAFQGYARMESLPGSAPQPSWVANLRWPSSPAFFVRWITNAETKFSRIAHLKNSLNEGKAVLVGRDGQEIDEACGVALCEAIDEGSKWNGGGGQLAY